VTAFFSSPYYAPELALAIAGFYLIVPPVSHGARFDSKVPLVDAEAPISEWRTQGFFESAENAKNKSRR
jgi:hypothetical protein